MAIYKNREVYVVGPNTMANSPETINVRYKDGTHENVSVGLVRFTVDEKKQLQKLYPSKFDDVTVTDDKDLEAVRVGVTPPSDPSFKEMAERQVQNQKQKELTDKNMESAKAEANKRFQDQTKVQPQSTPVVAPTNQPRVL
jgi:hypothetical protein